MSQSAGAWSEPHPVAREGERITGLVRSQIVALTDTPLFTSVSTPWAGFLLEAHGPRSLTQDVWWSWYRTHVCLVSSGTLGFQVRQGARIQHFQARAGNTLLFPRGFGEGRFLADQSDFQLICVELDCMELNRQRATRFLGGKSAASEGALLPQFDLYDPHVGALLRNMAAEIAGGCRAGKLYGQALSLSLAAYLEGRFSAEPVEQERGQRRFSRPQVQRLSAYIHGHLAEDLTLDHLADLLDMSPRQFFRLFSTSFGSTPHRYIVSQRVIRAKELLIQGLSSIETAGAVGFVNQSHFTDVFRRATGTTPARFRLENLPGLRGAHSGADRHQYSPRRA